MRYTKCGRAGSLQPWKSDPDSFSEILAEYDDRWVEAMRMVYDVRTAPSMVAEVVRPWVCAEWWRKCR